MKALLLAGGKGTRLWPISTANTPKQILSPFMKDKNLLEQTIERILPLGFNSNDLFLVTAQEQVSLLEKYWLPYNLNEIIAEPRSKNTGPATLLATKKLMELNTDPNESIYLFPSDHYIKQLEFHKDFDLSNKIICFSIIPTRVETGYGYIQVDNEDTVSKVKRFVEKPNFATAQEWYNDWSHNSQKKQQEKFFWNSGIYGFSLNSLGESLKKINPSLYDLWKHSSYQEFHCQYNNLSKIAFDKLIAEQADNLYCTPLNTTKWRDLGTWQSIHDALVKNNSEENINIGQAQLITTEDTTSCLIHSDKEFNIACAGVKDLTIIISGNNILIADKNNQQATQELLTILQNNFKELI